MNAYYRLSSRDFDVWFNQTIWINDYKQEARKYSIYDFADELTRWMRKKGYKMDSRWDTGRTVVANWLYRLSIRVKVGAQPQLKCNAIIGSIIHRNYMEDLHRFNTVVGSTGIEEFMEMWSLNEEFSPELPLGQAVQNELESLLWSYLDLDESEQGAIVLELMEHDHSDEEGVPTARRVDDYIQDAAEGYHGGAGYKV
jgi:hypothetical protein